jgi:hypothetical protein
MNHSSSPGDKPGRRPKSDQMPWESEARNQAELDAWDSQQAAERAKRRTLLVGSPSTDRKRYIALKILARVQDGLSTEPEGVRDERTRDAIYDLGKFVNEGWLSRAEVTDAITAAAYANGLDRDRDNGGIQKIEDDIPRGLDKAADDRLTVDWDRFDYLAMNYDTAAGGDGETTGSNDLASQPDDAEVEHDAAWSREQRVLSELENQRARREAKRRLDAEERPVITYPPVKSLAALLSEPDTPTRYRIESVAPENARIMLSAQYKAGKTTLVGNLLRSLVDGDKFLDVFTVRSTARPVLIDDEMSENMLRRWLRDQNIINTAKVADVVSLRGTVSAFNLRDDQCRAEWAARLRELGCDYLILDCLRPVLDALGLDENSDAGTFLVAFDALLAEAGIADAAIVQHMGHANERARGDSRLQDWPDAIWRLVRETEEPDSPRFFSAYGRDVDVHEGRLSFDPNTRRLSYAAGSRNDAKAEAAKLAVVRVLAEHNGEELSGSQIEQNLALSDHSRQTIRDGIAAAVKDEFVTVRPGPHAAKLHRITYPCSRCGMPVASRRDTHDLCQ